MESKFHSPCFLCSSVHIHTDCCVFENQCANAVCASRTWEQLECQPEHSIPGTGTSLCHGGLAHDCSVWVRCMGEETLGNACCSY